VQPAVLEIIQIFVLQLHTAFVINTTIFKILVTGVAAHQTLLSALNTKYQHREVLNVHTYVRFTYIKPQFKPLKVAFSASKMFPEETLRVENYVTTYIAA
jgi:hypothetical protein